MSLEADPNLDKTKAKPITLAGQEYFIAPLPLRQVIALADLIPKLKNITVENMSGAMFDPMIEMVRGALVKGYPKVTKDDLLDMPISIAELVAAVPVVVAQAGGRKAPAAGETPATNPLNPPTGAGSSPTL